jgi:hypothetical protein
MSTLESAVALLPLREKDCSYLHALATVAKPAMVAA